MSFTNQLPFAGVAGAPYGVVMVRTANFMTLLQGSPVGILAGQSGSASVPPDMVWDWLNKNLWVCTQSGGSPASTMWTQLQEVGAVSFTTLNATSGNFTGPVTIGTNLTVSGTESLGGQLTGSAGASFTGNLSAAGGTFTGPLSATSGGTLGGTFSGAWSAGGIVTFNTGWRLPNAQPGQTADKSGTYRTAFITDASNNTWVSNSGGGNVGFLNQAGSTNLLWTDNSGNAHATTMTTTGQMQAGSFSTSGTMAAGGISGTSLSVSGAASTGGLTVTGGITATTSIAGGSLSVSGAATTGSLMSNGDVHAGGDSNFGLSKQSGNSLLEFNSNTYIQNTNATDVAYFVMNGGALWYWNAQNGTCYDVVAAVGGNGAYFLTSDRRLKRNVAPALEGLDILTQLIPIEFERTGQANRGRELGFDADEVRKVLPAACGTMDDVPLPDGSRATVSTLTDSTILAVAVNAIKELSVRLARLEARREA